MLPILSIIFASSDMQAVTWRSTPALSRWNAEGGRRMKLIRKLVLVVASLATWLALPARAQDFIAGIPRNETLIIQGGAAQNADWFNLWAPGGGANTNGQQQLTSDTLWFINPEGGKDAWQNALATEPPIYNADFTQMTVKLRRGHLLERRRRVHRRRRGLHGADPDRSSRHELERGVLDQRRRHRGARPRHGGLPSQGAELAFPHPVHGALERGLDHAQARLRKGRRPAQVRQQSAGLAQRLCAQQLRQGRQLDHLEAARRLEAHLDRHGLGSALGEICRLSQCRQSGSAGDRAAQPQPRRHQRHRARKACSR